MPPIPGRLIAYGRSVDSWDSIKRFLYLAEGATASVAVTEGIGGMRQFHIAGKVEASDMDVDMRLERMLGHIPALVHPNPRSVLIVGVGAGVTAGALVIHPEVERIVICEIEPMVPASARQFFGNENHHVFDDPRVQLIFDDARHFLQTTDERFDIITTDPIHPWVRGAATLYSLEYLQLARAHLNPGGVVTQWIPLYETDVASAKSEIATFAQVFPDTTLWNPDLLEEGYDLVALGRVEPAPISETAIAARMNASDAVRESLSEVTLETAAAVISTYAGRGRDLAPWLADAQINRERHLRLQYLAGLAANTDQRFAIFQQILQYRRYPADLFEASAELESQMRLWCRPGAYLTLLLAGAGSAELTTRHVLLDDERAVLQGERHHDGDRSLLSFLGPLQHKVGARHADVGDGDRAAAASAQFGGNLTGDVGDGERTLLRAAAAFNGQNPFADERLRRGGIQGRSLPLG